MVAVTIHNETFPRNVNEELQSLLDHMTRTTETKWWAETQFTSNTMFGLPTFKTIERTTLFKDLGHSKCQVISGITTIAQCKAYLMGALDNMQNADKIRQLEERYQNELNISATRLSRIDLMKQRVCILQAQVPDHVQSHFLKTINLCVGEISKIEDMCYDNPGMGFNARYVEKDARVFKREAISALGRLLTACQPEDPSCLNK